MNRIVIIGTSCSGKTTLARKMAEILGVTHIELDAIHWLPDWQSRPIGEFRELTKEVVASERWVLDGNYSKVRDIIWARATTLIWLNYPFHIVCGRALYRTMKRVLTQEQLYAGNRETFKNSFLSKDSILWWVITTYQRRRREYPELFKQPEYAHLKIIELCTPTQAEQFVHDLLS